MATTAKKTEDSWIVGVATLVCLVLMFVWLTIPGSSGVNGLQIASLSFANGIFVGWADNLAAALFSNGDAAQTQALASYRAAILEGERYYPLTVLVFLLLGTFLSIGGVIAVMMARSAKDAGNAFKLGFFAEIAEGVVYNLGYYASTGRNGVTPEEVGITLVVGVIMGFVAIAVFNRSKKAK